MDRLVRDGRAVASCGTPPLDVRSFFLSQDRLSTMGSGSATVRQNGQIDIPQSSLSFQPVEVQMNLATGMTQISADPNQLLQVCLHVANNALQALDEVGGGIFSVKTRQKGDAVVIAMTLIVTTMRTRTELPAQPL